MDHSKCVAGSIATGTPSGVDMVVGGVNAYVAKPKEPTQSAVIIATDVFGHTLPNNRLIADDMAREGGFLVVVPDLFDGAPITPEVLKVFESSPTGFFDNLSKYSSMGFHLVKSGIPFFWSHGDVTPKVALVEAVIKDIKENHGITKVGVQGYCYGGKIAVLLAGKSDKIDAFGVAHPSMLTVPADIEAVQKPGLFCCAEIDSSFPQESRRQSEELLNKKGMPNKFVDYKGMNHGFAIRGDCEVPEISTAAKDALQQAVSFFKQYLA